MSLLAASEAPEMAETVPRTALRGAASDRHMTFRRCLLRRFAAPSRFRLPPPEQLALEHSKGERAVGRVRAPAGADPCGPLNSP